VKKNGEMTYSFGEDITKTADHGMTRINFAFVNDKSGSDESLLRSVEITYFDGTKELFSSEQLPLNEWKVFGTVALKYDEQKDDNGKAVARYIYVKDLLSLQAFYGKGREQAEEPEKRNR
jgi:hypothetical protein